MSKRRKIVSQINNDDTTKQENIINKLQEKKEENSSKKEKETVRITLDIPKPLHKKIKAYTKNRGLSIKGYLLFLASKDMDNR